MNEVTFKWRDISEKPINMDLPILCLTEKGKLMVLNDTKNKYKNSKGEYVYNSAFNNYVYQYRIRCWVYQYELLNNKLWQDIRNSLL